MLKLEVMHKMKFLSVIFKRVHTPDKFPEALKALFTQHFQVQFMDTIREIKMIFIQLIITKSRTDVKKLYRGR